MPQGCCCAFGGLAAFTGLRSAPSSSLRWPTSQRALTSCPISEIRAGAEERLDAPSLADTPVVGQFLGSLDALLVGVVDGVNEFTDFRASLPVAVDFLAAAGWALAVAVPLGLVALVVSYRDAQRRKAEFARFSLQVEELSTELDEIKRHVGYPNRG